MSAQKGYWDLRTYAELSAWEDDPEVIHEQHQELYEFHTDCDLCVRARAEGIL